VWLCISATSSDLLPRRPLFFVVTSTPAPRRNVPTSYKTKSGKNLGRWINNQRSAKAKGTLKDDREVRLVSTGLKWSVLTTNSWREMLRELEVYIETQTGGAPWDGNVPTNYKIRTRGRTNGRDEERNLGRWVNRQRSLHASGKLKRERKADLDRLGLRWSVQCASSWQGMYSHLSDYIRSRRAADPRGEWDGDVPISYRTGGDPPVNLGAWVARQRSAYVQRRLKEEYVRRLESVGLKWNIHEKHTFIHEDNFFGVEYRTRNRYVPLGQARAVPPPVRAVRTPLAERYLRRPAGIPGGKGGTATRAAPAAVRTVSAVVNAPAVVSSAVRRPAVAASAVVATPGVTVRRVPATATPAVPARAVPARVGATTRTPAVATAVRAAAAPSSVMASAVVARPAAAPPNLSRPVGAAAPRPSGQARPASLAGATTSASEARPQGATVPPMASAVVSKTNAQARPASLAGATTSVSEARPQRSATIPPSASAVAPTTSAQARPATLTAATTAASEARPQSAVGLQGAAPVDAAKASGRPAKPAIAPLLGLQKEVSVAAAARTIVSKSGAPTSEDRIRAQQAGHAGRLAPQVPPPKAEPTKLTTEKSKSGSIEL